MCLGRTAICSTSRTRAAPNICGSRYDWISIDTSSPAELARQCARHHPTGKQAAAYSESVSPLGYGRPPGIGPLCGRAEQGDAGVPTWCRAAAGQSRDALSHAWRHGLLAAVPVHRLWHGHEANTRAANCRSSEADSGSEPLCRLRRTSTLRGVALISTAPRSCDITYQLLAVTKLQRDPHTRDTFPPTRRSGGTTWRPARARSCCTRSQPEAPAARSRGS